MVIAGLTGVQLGALMGLCAAVTLLITGSTGSLCYTAVDSLDLGCLLRWDCPQASPNTTYTVQTKTQGDPWQDVMWCAWVSSHSCDLSEAFSHFDLYNMIRLGIHLTDGSTLWTGPRKFDYSDLAFSPPSLSVSLDGADRLRVEVQFPCAASRRCSLGSCCPVSVLIDPWTTVTVYNQLDQSDYKSRTVWTQEVVTSVDFSGLVPGQLYCAVANFSFPSFSIAASPKSLPRCVRTDAAPGLQSLMLGAGLCFVFAVSLIGFFLLKRRRQSAQKAKDQHKTPAPPEDAVTHSLTLVPPSSVPVDPCDVHVELDDDDDRASVGSCSRGARRTDAVASILADLQSHRRGPDAGIGLPLG